VVDINNYNLIFIVFKRTHTNLCQSSIDKLIQHDFKVERNMKSKKMHIHINIYIFDLAQDKICHILLVYSIIECVE